MTGELNDHLMCVLKAIKPNVLPSGLIYDRVIPSSGDVTIPILQATKQKLREANSLALCDTAWEKQSQDTNPNWTLSRASVLLNEFQREGHHITIIQRKMNEFCQGHPSQGLFVCDVGFV